MIPDTLPVEMLPEENRSGPFSRLISRWEEEEEASLLSPLRSIAITGPGFLFRVPEVRGAPNREGIPAAAISEMTVIRSALLPAHLLPFADAAVYVFIHSLL